ncbi:rhodanese-like domain-containing protein [Jatrophihabitans sp. YIM 134969]
MAAEPVDPRTAHAMQQAGDVVVDVRDPEEYASGHIAGAVNIPIGTLPAALEQLVPTGQVITTCSMGGRASKAARLLDLAGRDAFWVDGGTKAWAAAGFDVVRGSTPR